MLLLRKMKLKYAYPNERNRTIMLSDYELPLRPFFDTLIEIISIKGNILKGYVVHHENTKISYIEPEKIREECFVLKKRFGFFGKKVKKQIRGWVKLKERSYVEIDLTNMAVTKTFKQEATSQ